MSVHVLLLPPIRAPNIRAVFSVLRYKVIVNQLSCSLALEWLGPDCQVRSQEDVDSPNIHSHKLAVLQNKACEVLGPGLGPPFCVMYVSQGITWYLVPVGLWAANPVSYEAPHPHLRHSDTWVRVMRAGRLTCTHRLLPWVYYGHTLAPHLPTSEVGVPMTVLGTNLVSNVALVPL